MNRKTESRFVCQSCGAAFPKWLGRCPSCSGWNTLVEERTTPEPAARRGGVSPGDAAVVMLDAVSDEGAARAATGLGELDRVLGGGLVAGSFVLIGGEPGIGKSTLLLQAASYLARGGGPVLYVSAEESPAQVKMRAARLGLPAQGIAILASTQMEAVAEAVKRLKPTAAVVDSVQTIWTEVLQAAPGSVAQVRECAGMLMRLAKTTGTALLVVCHVTKDGMLAGPKTLEHLADCVLDFEGDRHHLYRILRAAKNRFGSTNEIGVFEMTGTGLKAVEHLSALFLPGAETGPVAGRAVAACMEGNRPLLVEVQALTGSPAFGMPQRRSAGVDVNRLAILLAVLDKRLGYHLSGADVFLNVAGGLTIDEPAADLASALAVVSAWKDRPLEKAACMGEVGLAGEVRPVIHLERRLEEAARMGFARVLVPDANVKAMGGAPAGLTVQAVRDLAHAVELALA